MNLFSTLLANWRRNRRLRKLQAAHKVITDAGLFVCNIETVAGAMYMIDSEGQRYRIGREKKGRK
jgi:recombinational DNA repair protein (RecF pathway)